MRVQTEEWRRFIPGSRMYKSKKTLFYNGEILWDVENHEYRVYDEAEQHSWEVVIVLPGVEVIPGCTFEGCGNIETVVMSDSVRRIEDSAFDDCESLEFVKLSRNLEFIGRFAFNMCISLSSIFIPPSCRQIGNWAFAYCHRLIILHVPRQTQLGENVIARTALIGASTFEIDESGHYETSISANVNEWIKNINRNDDQYALHRACSCYNPITEVIYEIVKRQGLMSFQRKNEVGITPLEYLEANPFAEDIDQSSVMKRYVLEMMGEAV
ncbi:leucine-rich repeat domain-containing protein [Chaetoceros tenuissimus]|uniref:Leucine-rich repeat domain-containing protein n=1 Tax=Chaetoceros tenuissimus TaxID=426638 RepID=A0AAD3H4I9_9STRA|nr:leucine-rich repeat domain-containing protein [Chaetoceros tenuissimus]